jgi:hypothetical protein
MAIVAGHAARLMCGYGGVLGAWRLLQRPSWSQGEHIWVGVMISFGGLIRPEFCLTKRGEGCRGDCLGHLAFALCCGAVVLWCCGAVLLCCCGGAVLLFPCLALFVRVA